MIDGPNPIQCGYMVLQALNLEYESFVWTSGVGTSLVVINGYERILGIYRCVQLRAAGCWTGSISIYLLILSSITVLSLFSHRKVEIL